MNLVHRNLLRAFLLLLLPVSAGYAGAQAGSTPNSRADASSPAAAVTDDEAAAAWIRKNAIPLNTVEAGHGFDDLEPLKTIVSNARIVALGEATHGTREFFQLKHRIIEWLAVQKGFTIFSIEANMPEAYRLNDFVLNGKGDPKELLKGMYFWTWDTHEVLDLILWMRQFNQSGKGHIEFTGFDMQTPTLSLEAVRTFVTAQDAGYYTTLEPIYQAVAQTTHVARSFGVATGTFPVKLAAGKHIKFSGYIRTEGVSEGWAGLWWRVDGKDKPTIAFDNMQNRGAKGTTPWTRYEISLDVPPDASNINFGILHPGTGTAWFDSLHIEVDGVPFTDSTDFDLDFESAVPRGFFTGGQGYEVSLDSVVAHSGKQSLRSKCVTPSAAPKSEVTEELLMAETRTVVEHLENNRARFLQAGATPASVDWVIQNARLVLQYLELKVGKKSRDQSMAENIQWIADHNPGGKIVLWAHNGHVQYQSAEWHPMGEYLRKMFPGQIVNFGFAFNEGSFRAVEYGKALHEFTVTAAPEGSLDRTLALTGLPLLALDLRQLPSQGQAAKWFAQPHSSRSIGAVYSEANPASYFVSDLPQNRFDVILFIEKTTAAKGN